ncbi:MAG TPA: amidohydrolase family protein [Mycobacteriales bacterium]|nr:amidohydrolase family protein [Mycobacteriales bacterium]
MSDEALLLSGGTVIDGTGGPPRRADVLIESGRIARIEPGIEQPGIPQIDVTGKIVCPGFVDIHTHSDLTVLATPLARSKIQQGVTTEIVGNCGLGVAPLVAGADIEAIRRSVSYLDLDPAVNFAWADTSGYLDAVRAARPSLNVGTLTAHIPLHAGVAGFGAEPATPEQLDRMCALLAESFAAGSFGLSTGLVYPPLPFVTETELLRLAETVAAHDRIFTWHVRDYGDQLLESVDQAVRVAERSGARTQVSHLVAVGKRNWGAVATALERIAAARADIGVDVYPYLHGNAPLSQLLPAWATEGGPEQTVERLSDSRIRAEIRREWQDRPVGWDEITISWLPVASELLGRTVAGIAEDSGRSGDDVVLDVLAEFGTAALMVAGGRSRQDLDAVLNHPAAVVASDGLALDPDGSTGSGLPHPRSYGCFPRYLKEFTAAELPAAIRRCTEAPARRMGLTDRGILVPGAIADVVVFTPGEFADTSTFADPHRFAGGLDLVLVGGTVAVRNSAHTGARSGAVITAGETA